jgi:Ca2+/H+ antiporter, TMEM165/GDT1 family
MNLALIATTFVLVAMAELPDKTMIATIVMGSRSRPVIVWLGAACAFTIQVAIAVIAGRFLELLPHRALSIIVTILFLAGAAYLLFIPERAEVEKGTAEAQAEPESKVHLWGLFATAFTVIFIGEFGDLTQLLTVNLVARYKEPYSIFTGALAALICVSAIGAFGGRALLRFVSVNLIRRIGGVALIGFAAYTIYTQPFVQDRGSLVPRWSKSVRGAGNPRCT